MIRVMGLLLLLGGCTAMRDIQACQSLAGPEPAAGLGAFGLIGALAQAADPDHQGWQAYVDNCVTTKRDMRLVAR